MSGDNVVEISDKDITLEEKAAADWAAVERVQNGKSLI